MEKHNNNNFCSNYLPIENQQIISYMDAMVKVAGRPAQCRGCTYYTSSSCKETAIEYKKFDTFC